MLSWFKKPFNIGITVGAAILAVVATVLLVWGITHHREGGLLKVCWSEEGTATYDTENNHSGELGEGTCERPEELRWPQKQIPITIASVEDENQARVLEAAAADLNKQVGFTLFRMVPPGQPSSASVAIKSFEGERSPPSGRVFHRRVPGGFIGGVYIRSDVASVDRLLFRVAKHEYLHLAGLEHDTFMLSLMYPTMREDWNSARMSRSHMTDFDISRLQGLYQPVLKV